MDISCAITGSSSLSSASRSGSPNQAMTNIFIEHKFLGSSITANYELVVNSGITEQPQPILQLAKLNVICAGPNGEETRDGRFIISNSAALPRSLQSSEQPSPTFPENDVDHSGVLDQLEGDALTKSVSLENNFHYFTFERNGTSSSSFVFQSHPSSPTNEESRENVSDDNNNNEFYATNSDEGREMIANMQQATALLRKEKLLEQTLRRKEATIRELENIIQDLDQRNREITSFLRPGEQIHPMVYSVLDFLPPIADEQQILSGQVKPDHIIIEMEDSA